MDLESDLAKYVFPASVTPADRLLSPHRVFGDYELVKTNQKRYINVNDKTIGAWCRLVTILTKLETLFFQLSWLWHATAPVAWTCPP